MHAWSQAFDGLGAAGVPVMALPAASAAAGQAWRAVSRCVRKCRPGDRWGGWGRFFRGAGAWIW
ncbi:hypothetical protein CFR74_11675 [Novacetimonas hansenii]|nr:hypothetical protein CFR74_11675 [Novacetimonas hansenii]